LPSSNARITIIILRERCFFRFASLKSRHFRGQASMASVVDIDPLLAPLPGENPAGESLPFELRARLEDMRITREGEDVPPEEVKKADWGGIISLAQETLTQTSKDLLVAARLSEALVKQNGFGGLRDGLRLLRMLVEQCWERVNPPIEDGDVEIRGGPFHWLDHPDRGARFPSRLRIVPLLSREDRGYRWLDLRAGQHGQSPRTPRRVRKGHPYDRAGALPSPGRRSDAER